MNKQKPNVILVIIDSFRADKFYEDESILTPNIKNIIKNGTYFSQTISSADATLLSWSSIFTGLYPFKTGIRSASFNKINSDVNTFFKIFQDHEYNFYGYIPKIGDIIGLFPNFLNDDSFYEPYKNLYESNGKILSDKIFDRLEGESKEPWFLVVHLYDLHDPIIIPKSFNDKKFGATPYEKQVSAIDEWIGKLVQKIDLENTLLILTADHGKYIKTDLDSDFESNPQIQRTLSKIGEHTPKILHPLKDKIFFLLESISTKKKMKMVEKLEIDEHEKISLLSGRADINHYLYDDKVRIPLLFAGYGVKKNMIVSQQTRSIDIFPTIFEIIGIGLKNEKIDGQSLKPLISETSLEEKPAYIESNPSILFKSNDVMGIRTSSYKYFRDVNDSKKRVYLYNLKKDPKETKNVVNSESEIVQKMETMLQEIRFNQKNLESLTNDEETKIIEDELKRLGYM